MDAALPPLTPGTLYLVATPIGNLEDITLRALRVLRECDVVAAEDTRHSGQLLKHFGISRPLLSYFQFNEAKRSEEIIERLRRGEKGCAGHGRRQSRHQRSGRTRGEGGHRRRLPRRAGARRVRAGRRRSRRAACRRMNFISSVFCRTNPASAGTSWNRSRPFAGTLVFYESPYRIEKLLGELNEVFPEREVVLARELTKKFEEFLRGKPADAAGDGREAQLERGVRGDGRAAGVRSTRCTTGFGVAIR